MLHPDYTQLIEQFPSYIPLPRIDRPHRSLNGTLAEVAGKSDLPSRLLFGDLVDDSFRKDKNGWSVEYRDGSGNGVDLKVSAGRFEAKSFFLGAESFSVGPAGHKEAFLQLISLSGEQWGRVLKKHLEARCSISVAEPSEDLPNACYLPDGWLRTLLIPLPLDRLEDVLNFHLDLAGDPLLGASQLASIALQSQVVNYVEGRVPEGCDDPMALIVRHLLSCNTPLVSPPVREVASDGTAAWTLRRMAYLYRCTCFLRDVPRIVEKLCAAGLLSTEPDMTAAVVPVELAFMAEHSSWWSSGRECRSTWSGFSDKADLVDFGESATADEASVLVRQANAAGAVHAGFFSLPEGD